jgi:hypothetical protein
MNRSLGIGLSAALGLAVFGVWMFARRGNEAGPAIETPAPRSSIPESIERSEQPIATPRAVESEPDSAGTRSVPAESPEHESQGTAELHVEIVSSETKAPIPGANVQWWHEESISPASMFGKLFTRMPREPSSGFRAPRSRSDRLGIEAGGRHGVPVRRQASR